MIIIHFIHDPEKVVDKRFEISNLLKDISELVKLSDTLMITF
jgi:hypothetical protein